MKIIIAGSRHLTDITVIGLIIEKELAPYMDGDKWRTVEIVSGHAEGVDKIGEIYASAYCALPYKIMPADWKTYGKAAGPIRNAEMGNYADMALVIWDGKSSGSKNMINVMKRLNKPCIEVIVASCTDSIFATELEKFYE